MNRKIIGERMESYVKGFGGKTSTLSNKGPACIGERGLHVRPDCVAFTHGEEMSAWYWPKFIL